MHNSDMDMPHAYKYHMDATTSTPDATYSKLPLQEKIALLFLGRLKRNWRLYILKAGAACMLFN